ncbi:MAG: B12-binding domain-containing radical SAM protein [Candidatus Omnitrophota bacterium]
MTNFITKTRCAPRRVLIVAPPYRLSPTIFPLGLMYIAAVLQKAGHQVDLIDMDVINLSEAEFTKQLRERDYDYLCTGGMITTWNFLRFACDYAKTVKPQATVIVGGGIITSTPQSFLSVSKADIGVIGEGEETVLDILDAIENRKFLGTVPGIVYREGGRIVETPKRAAIQDLDSIPFPAWDLFNVRDVYSRFPSHHSLFHAKRIGTIYTTRGCPFQCTFCYTEKKVRQRSVGNVIEEIKEMKSRYGIRHIKIADDLFVVRKERTIEFCEAVIREKLNISWSATGRCNIVEPKFLAIMKKAGCTFLGLGIESGSGPVLKAMKKNQTPQQIVEAVKMVQAAGITPGGTFILGMPGETHETVRETVALYKEINKYRTHVNRFFFATPYPGTPLYEHLRSQNKIQNEIEFFKLLSEKGDAVDFVINCTEELRDDEIERIKKEIEKEIFQDFLKKHFWIGVRQHLMEKTPLGKIHNMLLTFKMRGLGWGMRFLWIKLLVKLKRVPDPYARRWAFNRCSTQTENLIQDKTATF